MKRAIVAVLMVTLLPSGLLLGYVGGSVVTGFGNLSTSEFNFSDSTHIEASHAFFLL